MAALRAAALRPLCPPSALSSRSLTSCKGSSASNSWSGESCSGRSRTAARASVSEDGSTYRRKRGTPGTCQNCVERAEEWQAIQAKREGKVDFWIILAAFALACPFIGLGIGIATGYVKAG